jgi:hypothetical protein
MEAEIVRLEHGSPKTPIVLLVLGSLLRRLGGHAEQIAYDQAFPPLQLVSEQDRALALIGSDFKDVSRNGALSLDLIQPDEHVAIFGKKPSGNAVDLIEIFPLGLHFQPPF